MTRSSSHWGYPDSVAVSHTVEFTLIRPTLMGLGEKGRAVAYRKHR